MKLKELAPLITSRYIVGVRSGTEFIEEFDCCTHSKIIEYGNALVTGIHVFNEDMIAINVDVSEN